MNIVLKKGSIINVYTWARRCSSGCAKLSTIVELKLPKLRSYETAVEDLNSLQSNLITLENIWKTRGRLNQRSIPEMINLCERVGYQVEDFNRLNVIHVTGTKGKGSTCALSESILRNMKGNNSLKTGLFTSPHLIEVRERIRINGAPIDKDSFTRYFYECWERLEETRSKALDGQPDRPSYFRFLNLMAYHIFMQEQVDVAIMEVGVGGEYDSTNIIQKPVVCGISALGIDHQAVLGNTIEEIAWHKAGIIKPNVPVFTVPQPEEAMRIIEKRALEKDAPLHVIPPHGTIRGLEKINIGLAGDHQISNSSLAISLCDTWNKLQKPSNESPVTIQALDSVPQEFIPGLKNVKWPGRGQKLITPGFTETEWYLDGAHTLESMKVCTEWFSNAVAHEECPAENILLFNSANGRDGLAQIKLLSEIQQKVNFKYAVFCPNLTHSRIKPNDSRNIILKVDHELSIQRSLANTWISMTKEIDQHHTNLFPDIEHAVNWILSKSNPTKRKRRVLVTGSLHLVGGVMTVLGAECT